VAVFESQEMKGILAGAINRLGEREKIAITLYYDIAITLYYDEGLTLAEIGRSWASPSRACARCTPRPCSSSGPRCRTLADEAESGRRGGSAAAKAGSGPKLLSTISWMTAR
jgi:hypothetical protein